MSLRMPESPLLEQVEAMILAGERGDLTASEMATLGEILRTNPDARRFYACYMLETCRLRDWAESASCLPVSSCDVAENVGRSSAEERADMPVQSAPPLNFLAPPIQGVFGYFAPSWPMAYLVATVMTALGLMICANMYISPPGQIVGPSTVERPAISPAPHDVLRAVVVGRITGMADCQWSVDGDSKNLKSPVSIGDHFSISSGLLEIRYDTGAKVILQGPVTYEVESKNGGFLPVGRLTGKVETKAASGFCVRTPTAMVTDLGTEFGIEVDAHGVTTSHVFRGTIELRTVSVAGKKNADVRILHANETASVEEQAGLRRVVLVSAAPPSRFVREIPAQGMKMFDLVDVVAGGNGFSGRRNHGIWPIGKIPEIAADQWRMDGDYSYHRVPKMPFVDGIFILDGGRGAVQVDSAGHRCGDFPKTDNYTVGTRPIWGGVGILKDEGNPKKTVWPTVLTYLGVDYSKPGHGLLLIVPNQGITFDLEAIRRANPGYAITNLRSIVANVYWEDPGAYRADFWVLVDGEVRKRFHEINSLNRALPLTVPIRPTDRFLTLATTDGGDGIAGDFTIFGDPRLELREKGREEHP